MEYKQHNATDALARLAVYFLAKWELMNIDLLALEVKCDYLKFETYVWMINIWPTMSICSVVYSVIKEESFEL